VGLKKIRVPTGFEAPPTKQQKSFVPELVAQRRGELGAEKSLREKIAAARKRTDAPERQLPLL